MFFSMGISSIYQRYISLAVQMSVIVQYLCALHASFVLVLATKNLHPAFEENKSVIRFDTFRLKQVVKGMFIFRCKRHEAEGVVPEASRPHKRASENICQQSGLKDA